MADILKIHDYIKNKDVTLLQELIQQHELTIVDGKLIPVDKTKAKEYCDYLDLRQHIKKINLNSTYGCLLEKNSKFYDHRLGQSTTLTGRCITRHMTSKINEIFVGEYTNQSNVTVAGDTDSVYFTVYNHFKENNIDFEFTNENVIELYDYAANIVNDSFKSFMCNAFNIPESRGNIIKASREAVASKAMFVSKKRYGMLIIDKEGHRLDVNGKKGKLKVMGLEIKRSDTPKIVQNILQDLLMMVLCGCNEQEFNTFLLDFEKNVFSKLEPWKKGRPQSVNGLDKYELVYNESIEQFNSNKVNLPQNVAASFNWNTLREVNNDIYTMKITNGNKIIVCKLKKNPYNMNSVAIPVDINIIPTWFKELPFDTDSMEDTVLEKKVQDIFGCTGFNIQVFAGGIQERKNRFFSS